MLVENEMIKNKKRIGFVFISHHDLRGGGGAERIVSNAFEFYQERKVPKYDVFFFTDRTSYENLRSIGKLNNKNRIVLFRSSKTEFLMRY